MLLRHVQPAHCWREPAWLSRKLLLVAGLSLAPMSVALAGPVGIGAFGAPSVSTTQFNSLGTGVTGHASPYTLGIATYSANQVNVWSSTAGSPYQDCMDGCVTNQFGLANNQALSFSLDQAYGAIGVYVGQAVPYLIDVSFYDSSSNLLGTIEAVNGSVSGGLTFAGWSAPGGVETVQLTSLISNSFDVAAASIYTVPMSEPIPEPSTPVLVAAGIVGFGAVRWRSKISRVSHPN